MCLQLAIGWNWWSLCIETGKTFRLLEDFEVWFSRCSHHNYYSNLHNHYWSIVNHINNPDTVNPNYTTSCHFASTHPTNSRFSIIPKRHLYRYQSVLDRLQMHMHGRFQERLRLMCSSYFNQDQRLGHALTRHWPILKLQPNSTKHHSNYYWP